MVQRETNILIEDGFTDAVGSMPHNKNVAGAIGYLSAWAIGGDTERYVGKVNITCFKGGNIGASYHDRLGMATYHIMAIYDEGNSYTYHS